jgi:hypothetical protein
MNAPKLGFIPMACVLVLIAACGGGGGGYGGGSGGGGGPQNQTITFANAGSLSGVVGETVTNTASGGAGTGAITYASSNTAVATVNATSGVATLLAAGSTTITATKAASSGYNSATASYTLNVSLAPQTISFAQPGPLNVVVGRTGLNMASGGAGTGAITYVSSDLSVLTVHPDMGVVTGVARGTATVTATKAADAAHAQAQATYTVHVLAEGPITAWIGGNGAQVNPPAAATGKQLSRARISDCATPATCADVQTDPIAGTPIADTAATLGTPAYYTIADGSVPGDPLVVSTQRFSERIGHVAVHFKGRYWVIGGATPNLPASGATQHTTLADIWSSADGRTWKRETDNAPFGPRWFHHAVVFQGRIWLYSGARGTGGPMDFLRDAWSSDDGVNWVQRTNDIGLPWYSTHMNVVAFSDILWIVSGGRSLSSTDGITWTLRSAVNAIGGGTARGYASLTIFGGNLWYIAGSPTIDGSVNGAVNDVWRSTDGVTWTQVNPSAPFSARIRHSSFVIGGRLWIFGGQVPGTGNTAWASDAWSTTDGVNWTREATEGLDAVYLAATVRDLVAPTRVALIGGIQRGYSNLVWESTNGREWTELSSNAEFSPRVTRGVSFDGALWAIGGSTVNPADGDGADTNEVWRSTDGLTWTRVATTGAIFSPRDGHTVTVFDNQLWVIGGWDNEVGAGGTDTRFGDVWSSADGVTWTEHSPTGPIFSPRAGHAAAVFGGRLWIMGGSLQNGEANDVWSTADGDTWVEQTAAAQFPARHSHSGTAFNGALYVIGGGTTLGTADVWRSIDGVNWTARPAPPFAARTRHESLVFNGRLYVAAGASGEDYLSSTYYRDVWSTADGDTWRQETATAVNAGRGVPIFAVHSGSLFLIGGYGVQFYNDVWRSSDGIDWQVSFRQTITIP